MYQLVSTDDLGGRLCFPLVRKRTIIGRDSACDIQLHDEEISRQHAKIYIIDGQIYIKDCDSTNGVYVNNQRIQRMTTLGVGDEVIIGSHQFHLRSGEPTAEDVSHTTILSLDQLRDVSRREEQIKIDPEDDDAIDHRTAIYDKRELVEAMYKRKIGLASHAALEVIFGKDKGRKFMLPPGNYVIGRGADCEIRLDDPRVSSRHAGIDASLTACAFDDLNSLNGSLINNRQAKQKILAHDDVLVLGNTKLKFRMPPKLRPRSDQAGIGPEAEAHARPGVPLWLSVVIIGSLAAAIAAILIAIALRY